MTLNFNVSMKIIEEIVYVGRGKPLVSAKYGLKESVAWSAFLFSIILYLYLTCIGRRTKGEVERSANNYRHLNLWNGCLHSETSFKTNTHCYFSMTV